MAYAGGIMTNTNQSASYVRMPARSASLGIDAVYYNPAGLTGLSDGFHLSLNNQVISQIRKIDNQLPLLNRNEFQGEVSAPLFPGIYAAYKTGNLTFSFGFNPVGGGGGAEYEDGLPSFATSVAGLVPLLEPTGVSGYRNEVYFEGSSIFFGSQLGVSYEINDVVSVSGAARYVTASNSYEGYLRNIEVSTPAGWMRPGTYLRDYVAPTQPEEVRSETLATADAIDNITADAEVEAVQKGSTIIPVFGLSIKPNERLNFGIKYEFLTRLELENETTIDGTGMFPDGQKTRSDMPAMLSFGAAYKVTPRVNIAGGMHYYFDKTADYGRELPNRDIIDNNFVELALGLEYSLTESFLISAGYLRTQTGVNEDYHNDLSHSLSTNSFGLGGHYIINEMVAVNLGFMRTFYLEDSKEVFPTIREIYNRDAMVFAIGLDFRF